MAEAQRYSQLSAEEQQPVQQQRSPSAGPAAAAPGESAAATAADPYAAGTRISGAPAQALLDPFPTPDDADRAARGVGAHVSTTPAAASGGQEQQSAGQAPPLRYGIR